MDRHDGESTDHVASRRRVLRTLGVAASGAFAGCQGLPFGPGSDAAYYRAYGPALDVDYDAVLQAGRDADYDVDEPYYVGTKESNSGFHPDGPPALAERLGPDYLVFGETFYYSQPIWLECWFGAEGTATVSVFDDRTASGSPDAASLPPVDWLIRWLTLAFEMGENRAREYVEDLKDAVAEGTDVPSVEVTEPPAFSRTYETLAAESTATSASETHGDGWYELSFLREGTRFAALDLVAQSAKFGLQREEHRYTVKLDRLGGFNLTVQLSAGEEIPESEYRGVFRQMFSTLGLPPEVVDDLTFEYTPSVW